MGKIYDDHRKFTLHIQYDPLGRPLVWSPSSKYTEVNVSYTGGSLLAAIHRGDWSERLDYENERVVSRTWVNGKIWSYTYADRVSQSVRQIPVSGVSGPAFLGLAQVELRNQK